VIRVMIVEDEMLIRMGLKAGIPWEALGCQVIGEAADGLEALALYPRLKPDLVFLDIGMPRMDGLAFFEKAKTQTHQASFVILSSHNEFDLVKRAVQLGAADYIHKLKFSVEEISQIIARLPRTRSASAAPAAIQEMCPVLSLEDAMRDEPPYTGACAALLVEEERTSLAEREQLVRDVAGQALRGICPVFLRMEERRCLLLLVDLPEWMGPLKVIEIAGRMEDSLNTCLRCSALLLTCGPRRERASLALADLNQAAAMNRYVRVALRWVHRHYARPLTLAGVSEQLRLNESYFASLFKREMGVSFVAFLNQFRMHQAQELLRSGESVKAAASAVGFESVSYFDRLYKRMVGSTPSQEREGGKGCA
jgi:two-component system response regulator YesN